MLEAVLPQNVEAEEQILGAMLMSEKAGDKAIHDLTEDCFFLEKNAQVFSVMKNMLANGIPTDPVTVAAELARKGLSEDTGGRVRLHELVGLMPATSNVHVYIRDVKDAWKRRLVLKACTEIINNIDTIEDPVGEMEKHVLEMEQSVGDGHELVASIKDLIEAKRYQMEHPESAKPGIPTPFSFLPDLVGGRLYVLSGYMKDGKSRAALQFAASAAEAGEKVGFASAEMSKKDLFDAWACQRTGLPHWKVAEPWRLDPLESKRLDEALTEMSPWRVEVIDDEYLDPSRLRRYQRSGKYDLLLVDHLHTMSWKDRHHLDQGVKTIRNIAREFEIPVILLAQMNRSTDYANPYPPPTMNRLKESSTIEAESSAVWFVYRERDEHNQQTSRGQFIVAANRYGKVDRQVVYFDDASQTFQETEWEPVQVEESVNEEGFPF